MLRGMARMLVGSIVLAVSAWISFQVWQKAPALSIEWTGKSIDSIPYALTAASFLASFFRLRMVAKSIVRPFGKKTEEETPKPASITRLAFRLLLALIPTSINPLSPLSDPSNGTPKLLTSKADS